jgi:GntR family transcriptional regulator, transcriptional repressor for pyruvate dehydrogenase complex
MASDRPEFERLVRPPKTHEHVAERIRAEIVSGRYPIGSRLPSEEELTSQLGVGRTTLREALLVLESQGLLEIRRGRMGGPVVTLPDLERVAQNMLVALRMRGVETEVTSSRLGSTNGATDRPSTPRSEGSITMFDNDGDDDPVRAQKTHEVLAGQIRRDIVSGNYPPGTALPSEDDLVEQFGVGRTTLREALRVLESQDLIEIRRGRGGGPIVKVPNLRTMTQSVAVGLHMTGVSYKDLQEAVALLEPPAAARFAELHTAEDLVAVRAAVDMTADATKNHDLEKFGMAAHLFHTTVAERSGNTTLATLTLVLHHLLASYHLAGARRTTDAVRVRAVRDYERIFDRMKVRDAAGTEKEWRRLLRQRTRVASDARYNMYAVFGDESNA